MYQLDGLHCAIICVAVATIYSLLFAVVWRVADRYHPRFRGPVPVSGRSPSVLPEFDEGDRADFSSRVLSTLHCIVILPIIAVEGATLQWNYDFTLSSSNESLVPLEVALCISAGYFFGDLVMTIVFRFALWPVFAVHHVLALAAICTNILNDSCRFGSTILIALFMLVEATTIPLNVQTFTEQVGYPAESLVVTLSFYTTVLVWVPSRLIVPIAMDVLMIQRIALSLNADELRCFIPAMISAFLITIFCVGVFVAVLLPAVWARWHSASKPPPQNNMETLLTHLPPA